MSNVSSSTGGGGALMLSMSSFGVLWSQYGPYHFARVAALKSHADSQTVHALEIASNSTDYHWNRSRATVNLITLFPGAVVEQLSFWRVFLRTRRSFAQLKLDVCFLPSYSPKQPLAALLAAKSLGIRTVMMTESHLGTRKSRALGTWFKRRLVRMFDSALVGGKPQRSYVESLGLPEQNIFLGYDVVDNDYFERRADEVRAQAAEYRAKYDLPEHYFLNLGRFVAKKNLATLIRAYRRFLDTADGTSTHLVMVGSGQDEANLKMLCQELRLPVYNKTSSKADKESRTGGAKPGVHFYGFRQIEENPIFYGLADAFILPSSLEEWGLVVNEAMSCGLPVVVSEKAGCVEDLLRKGTPPGAKGSGLGVHGDGLADRAAWAAQTSGRMRQNGFTFDPNSVDSLTGALLVLDADPALRQSMGRASRSIVADYSCDRFAKSALLAAQTAMSRA